MTMQKTPTPPATKMPMTVKNRIFRTVESDFVHLEKGVPVEGVLVKIVPVPFASGDTVNRYTLQPEGEGSSMQILGSVHLDDLLSNVALGTYVRITLLEPKKSSAGRIVKQYQLDISE